MIVRTFLAVGLLFSIKTAASAENKPAIPPQTYQYPLKVSADGKHLTDQTDTPFLVIADVAWQLLRKLDYQEAVQYLDIRKGQSFNTILVHVLPSLPTQRNFQKVTPFQGENDITNPNKVYFDYLEKVVSAAKERNIAVGLVVSRQSWNVIFESQGEEACRTFGEYIGKRFSKLNNIFWIVNEDENQKDFLSKTLTESLKKTSENKLVASLSTCSPPDSLKKNHTDLKVFIPDSTVTDSEYAALATWQKNIGKSMKSPFLIANSEFPIKDQSALIRKQAYESLLNSAAGFCHMSTIKNFNPTWKTNITKDGGEYMKYLVKILKGLPWDYLEPAASLKMVQDTTQSTEISVSALTNKRMVMMYIPTFRSFGIDLSQLTGEEFHAVWYSPRTGRRWSGGTLKRKELATIEPPDPQPEWDWILLVGSKN
ncbi:apiosidase-like domain-containing protein [Dyadobacter frigoris]|uniref:DUF4038 domain-containing protein n=1 Tax=Dyadobacter frigoris TaxID=2576211 RepID=A0A4U6D8H8_9BACT|nr:DUF4038 domain-containing protein [Dyadobacter frigoris]TKT92895.1 DUF4038 domain-containing protein [Dyadobacter frigoris]GLU54329.1 hypothetical protein Dfri01_37900 [Dyadobacter frigoris]